MPFVVVCFISLYINLPTHHFPYRFERAEELRRQKAVKSKEVESLQGTTPETIWNKDLDAIEELLDEKDKALGVNAKKQKSKKKQTTKGRRKKVDEVSCIGLDFHLLDTVSF